MPDISKLPPIVKYLITVATAICSLLLSEGFIDNRTEKLLAGLASILLPAMYLVMVSVWRLAHARETAARILAGQPTGPPRSP